jgi:GDP-4-dehydro-6-deoxy-D-mannose reductase
MKAMLIGGSGFVGKHLALHLASSYDWEIVITGLPGEREDVEHNGVGRFVPLNIMEKEQIQALLEKERPQYIFHLAAQSSVAASWASIDNTIDINIKGSTNLLEAIRAVKVYDPKILMIGSGEEYGRLPEGTRIVSETTVPRPANPYAMTKATQTMLGQLYANAYRMHIIIARPFNHIGPGQREGFVVSDFCKQVAEILAGKEPVVYVGNLTAARDFTDVRDVVRAYSLLIQHGIPGEIYNIGSGNAIPIQTVLDEVIRLSGVEVSIKHDPKKFRPVDYPSIAADISKLQRIINWKPEIPLARTITDSLSDWKFRLKRVTG